MCSNRQREQVSAPCHLILSLSLSLSLSFSHSNPRRSCVLYFKQESIPSVCSPHRSVLSTSFSCTFYTALHHHHHHHHRSHKGKRTQVESFVLLIYTLGSVLLLLPFKEEPISSSSSDHCTIEFDHPFYLLHPSSTTTVNKQRCLNNSSSRNRFPTMSSSSLAARPGKQQ